MKTTQRFIFVFLILFSCTILAATPPLNDIFKAHKKTFGDFENEEITATLLTKTNNKPGIERKIRIKRKKFSKKQTTKTKIEVLQPAELQGLTFLLHQSHEKESKQWIFLPSLKKVQRITHSNREGYFAGSEFTYKDLMPFDYSQYRFELLESDTQNSFQIKGTPLDSNDNKTFVVLKISENDYLLRQIDFYGDKQNVIKTAYFENFKKVNDDAFRPYQIRMVNPSKHRESILKLTNVNYEDLNLTDADFSLRALKR